MPRSQPFLLHSACCLAWIHIGSSAEVVTDVAFGGRARDDGDMLRERPLQEHSRERHRIMPTSSTYLPNGLPFRRGAAPQLAMPAATERIKRGDCDVVRLAPADELPPLRAYPWVEFELVRLRPSSACRGECLKMAGRGKLLTPICRTRPAAFASASPSQTARSSAALIGVWMRIRSI